MLSLLCSTFLRNMLKKFDLIKVTLSKSTRSKLLHLCLKEHLKKLSSLLQTQVLNATSLSQCSEVLNLVVPLTSSSSHISGIVANGYYTLLAYCLPFYLCCFQFNKYIFTSTILSVSSGSQMCSVVFCLTKILLQQAY